MIRVVLRDLLSVPPINCVVVVSHTSTAVIREFRCVLFAETLSPHDDAYVCISLRALVGSSIIVVFVCIAYDTTVVRRCCSNGRC